MAVSSAHARAILYLNFLSSKNCATISFAIVTVLINVTNA